MIETLDHTVPLTADLYPSTGGAERSTKLNLKHKARLFTRNDLHEKKIPDGVK
jgi:hypothetical protein